MAQTHTVILVVDRLVIGADADVERSALCCLWHDGGPLSKSSPHQSGRHTNQRARADRRAPGLDCGRDLPRRRHQRRQGARQRPGLDAMLKDAGRRNFDIVMAWAIDRLGRSLIDLLRTIQAASTSTLISSTSTRPRRRASCFSRSRDVLRIRAGDDPATGAGRPQCRQGQN